VKHSTDARQNRLGRDRWTRHRGGHDRGRHVGDVGKTVDVTLRGDTAYSRDLILPLLRMRKARRPFGGGLSRSWWR